MVRKSKTTKKKKSEQMVIGVYSKGRKKAKRDRDFARYATEKPTKSKKRKGIYMAVVSH